MSGTSSNSCQTLKEGHRRALMTGVGLDVLPEDVPLRLINQSAAAAADGVTSGFRAPITAWALCEDTHRLKETEEL